MIIQNRLALLLLSFRIKMNSLISIENLSAEYRPFARRAVRALDKVSLNLDSAEVLGLFGLNGAGKTTVIRIILGMMQARQGKISIMGLNPINSREKILANLGVILEGERYLESRLKADDIITAVGASYNIRPKEIRKRADELFIKLNFEDHRHKMITEYSRGMRQKLSLLLAILHKPKILLLDEPIIALDVETTQEFLALLRELADSGCGVIISSHQINTISNVIDKAVILRNGKTIFEASRQELIEIVAQGKLKFIFKSNTGFSLDGLPSGIYFENSTFTIEANTSLLAEFFNWAKQQNLELDRLEPIQDLEAAFLKINQDDST